MIRKRRPSFKPCMEILEHRFCPSSYSVTDLGTLGGTYSQAEDISPTGQVVGLAARPGDSGSAGAAFLWQNGVMNNLGTLGGPNSIAAGINKFTQVVGGADTASNTGHAFLWQNGVMTDLGTLGGSNSAARDINSTGQVVGGADTATSGVFHAFEWQNGVMTDLNNLIPANSGWVLTGAWSINDNGQIAGQGTFNGQAAGFLLSGSVVTYLGTLGGTHAWLAYALNNSTQVVGLDTASKGGAFLYSGGTMTDLGTLNGSNIGSTAFDINTFTQVVGESHTDSGLWSGYNAFIWQNGKMTNLNNLIPKNSGWQLHEALAINDTGCIVGMGTNASGQNHAFLAIPPSMAPTTSTATASTIGSTNTIVSSPGTPPAGIAIDSVRVSQTLLPSQGPALSATQPSNGLMPSAFASALDSAIAGGGQVDEPAPAGLGTLGHALSPDVVDALFSDFDGSVHVRGFQKLSWLGS